MTKSEMVYKLAKQRGLKIKEIKLRKSKSRDLRGIPFIPTVYK